MTMNPPRVARAALGLLLLFVPSAAADCPGDRVATTAAPRGGRPVTARLDGAGDIHLLYDSEDGPCYATSRDGGRTFDKPIPIVAGPRPPGLEYQGWDLAVGRAGRVHVALGTNAWKLKLPPHERGLFYTALDPDGAAFAPLKNLNRRPSEGFSLAADGAGSVTACWLADKLYSNVSRDDGATFGPNTEVDPRFDPCNCCTTSASYSGDGRLAVLYREESGGDRDMYLVLWDQAKNSVTRRRVGRTPWHVAACPMTYFAANPAPGGFAVAWPTKGRVCFARLDRQGEPLGSPEVETPGRSGMRTGVLALAAPDGTTLVAWKVEGRANWQLHDPEGRPVGPPGQAPSVGVGVAAVIAPDGRFVIVL